MFGVSVQHKRNTGVLMVKESGVPCGASYKTSLKSSGRSYPAAATTNAYRRREDVLIGSTRRRRVGKLAVTIHSNNSWATKSLDEKHISQREDEKDTVCEVVNCDLLILGSGIAGLTCALEAAESGTKVCIVTKNELMEGSTKYAQGGVAAVMPDVVLSSQSSEKKEENEQKDCVTYHVEDTMNAGCYLNDKKAVEILCKEGPQQVKMLCQMGVPFTTTAKTSSTSLKEKKEDAEKEAEVKAEPLDISNLHLGKEGGHSHPRVVHAADTTGAAIMKTLVEKTRRHPNIQVHEHKFALDLLTGGQKNTTSSCFGCDSIDLQDKERSSCVRFVSKCTVIATGGCGQLYPKTTNPGVATGDGVAMAARAGASVQSMEFIQFHPTSLYVEEGASSAEDVSSVFLISEAVRGAGAVLRNANGEKFMKMYDPRADLAPRDIVARGIYDQMKLHGTKHVYLDATHLSREQVDEEFPHISSHVKTTLGIDMSRDWIPVVPAQHYACGGILTNTRGETNVKGLYAIGEAACTGVHGANRLASNSLLEGLVFGKRAVGSARTHMDTVDTWDLSAAEHCQPSPLKFTSSVVEAHERSLMQVEERYAKVQTLMWKYAGILRSDKGLHKGLEKVRKLKAQLEEDMLVSPSGDSFGGGCTSMKHVELINMVHVAELILQGAIERETSAGLHCNVDRPEPKTSTTSTSTTSTSFSKKKKADLLATAAVRKK